MKHMLLPLGSISVLGKIASAPGGTVALTDMTGHTAPLERLQAMGCVKYSVDTSDQYNPRTLVSVTEAGRELLEMWGAAAGGSQG